VRHCWGLQRQYARAMGLAVDILLGRLPRVLREAPIDDEPDTDEERQLVEEGRPDLAAGRVVSQAEIRREFGSS
jgi:hypothetical protein